jgi:hypothetical protein
MGDVIRLPRREQPLGVATTALARAAPMRWLASWDIDDWGRDATLARLASRILQLRWEVTIGGLDALPANGPAVIVVNTWRFRLTPWFVALALSDACERPVRFVGRPDTAPHGALARRLGGLLARPDEVAGALRDGQLLVVGLGGTLDARRVGTIDPVLLEPAGTREVPVFPAAVTASDTSRSARIEIAEAIATPRRRRGSLAEVELARRVEARVGELLAGFADARSPFDRLPWPLLGGG